MITVLGTTTLPVSFKGKRITSFEFFVVPNIKNLLGLDLFRALGFVIMQPDQSELGYGEHTESVANKRRSIDFGAINCIGNHVTIGLWL